MHYLLGLAVLSIPGFCHTNPAGGPNLVGRDETSLSMSYGTTVISYWDGSASTTGTYTTEELVIENILVETSINGSTGPYSSSVTRSRSDWIKWTYDSSPSTPPTDSSKPPDATSSNSTKPSFSPSSSLQSHESSPGTISLVQTTVTSEVTNFIPQNGTTLSELSTITPVMIFTVMNGKTLSVPTSPVASQEPSDIVSGFSSTSRGSNSPTNDASSPIKSSLSVVQKSTTEAVSVQTTISGTVVSTSNTVSSTTSSTTFLPLSSNVGSSEAHGTTQSLPTSKSLSTSATESKSSHVTLTSASTNSGSIPVGTNVSSSVSAISAAGPIVSQIPDSVSSQAVTNVSHTGIEHSLSMTFSTEDIPINHTGASTGLITDPANVTWTIVPVTDYFTETGLDSLSSTVTISYITTFLIPSAVGSVAPPQPTPGATSYIDSPALTSSFSSCFFTNDFNPFLKTSSCSIAPVWTTTSRTYDPWCTLGLDGVERCLCPFCTKPQKECLDIELPTPGHCPEGFLCSLSQPAGHHNLVWNWQTTPNVDLPWCATQWDEYVTCVTAHDKSSCSQVTYHTTIETSTSTDSNGTVWIMPFFTWACSDLLCSIYPFKLPEPFSWIEFWSKCIFTEKLSCINWFFHGFPPAPKLDFPPVGPPTDDWVLKPTAISNWIDGTEYPKTQANNNPASSPEPLSSCSEKAFSYTTKYCSTVVSSNMTTATSCVDAISIVLTCTGHGSIVTSTVPCASTVQTGVSLVCPSHYTDVAQCTSTNGTWTFSGCSASTSIVEACPISIDYNDPAIAATLSIWLSQFTFTIPADLTVVTTAGSTASSLNSSTTSEPGVLSSSIGTHISLTSKPGLPPGSSNKLSTTNSTITLVSETDIPPDVSKSAWSWLSSDASLASQLSVESQKSSVASVLSSIVSGRSSKVTSTTKQSPTSSVTPTTSYSFSSDTKGPASFSSWLSESLASQSASERVSQARETASSAAFSTPTGADFCDKKLQGQTICAMDQNSDPLDNSPQAPFQWFHASKDQPFYKDAERAICHQLRSSGKWDPSKGWHYSWNSNQAPGLISREFNVTFALQFAPCLRCSFGKGCRCFHPVDHIDYKSYCPPSEDGTIQDDFWEGERCVYGFYNAITPCYDRGHLNTGGWFLDDGFIWSVLSHQRSPTFYWPQQGDGTESLHLKPLSELDCPKCE